jgi:hydrogenase maturation protein HypF
MFLVITVRAIINIKGVVQGVGLRPFVYSLASDNNLHGLLRNQGDSTVLIVVQGTKQDIENFLADLESKKPHLAVYFDIAVEYAADHSDLVDFKIEESTMDKNNYGSVIPPDVAVCEKCVREMHDVQDRRYGYFLISCNDCGPRFSIVYDIPYDRQRTSMNNFAMCRECQDEFATPGRRRSHSQAIACVTCGPSIFLTGRDGKVIENDLGALSYAAKLIESGKILAIKGVGGFHLAASSLNSDSLSCLRAGKG